jgi:hypothetical protein
MPGGASAGGVNRSSIYFHRSLWVKRFQRNNAKRFEIERRVFQRSRRSGGRWPLGMPLAAGLTNEFGRLRSMRQRSWLKRLEVATIIAALPVRNVIGFSFAPIPSVQSGFFNLLFWTVVSLRIFQILNDVVSCEALGRSRNRRDDGSMAH